MTADRPLRRRLRQEREQLEYELLAPAASKAAASKGREDPEEPDEFRTAYQRDRDRILHTKAFRRLKHKTQVFINPEGDHFVTRLTHTLQVTQIGRAMATGLGLNEVSTPGEQWYAPKRVGTVVRGGVGSPTRSGQHRGPASCHPR